MSDYYYSWVYILSVVVGLCVGSFLNVVIYRVPNKMSVIKPASHCPNCGYVLKPKDIIPVISYIMLHGKCRSCEAKISFRYTAVEILNAVMWLACALVFAHRSLLLSAVYMVLSSTIICIAFIDMDNQIIPDRFNLIILVLGILMCFLEPVTVTSRIIGMVAAGVFFIAILGLSYFMFGRPGIGGGDIKLMIVSGLFLGWQSLILAVIIGSLIGSIVLIIIDRTKKKSTEASSEKHELIEYPFGPFLALGISIASLCGQPIISWYLGLF